MKNSVHYLLYCKDQNVQSMEYMLPAGLFLTLWEPSITSLKPRKAPIVLSVWWFYYFFKIALEKKAYSVVLVYKDDVIVHRTVISSKCFKFPFMNDGDIQIGPSWTSPECRNQKIASSVISGIVRRYEKEGGKIYWISREANYASRELIEGIGFEECGRVKKKKLMGIVSIFEKTASEA